MWHFTPFAVPLFLGTVLCYAVALFSWQRRSIQGATYLFWASITLSFYLIGYAMELGSPSLDVTRFWLKFQYIGVTITPALYFALGLSYTGSQRVITPYSLMLLLIIPILTLLFAWTNELHGLIWQDMSIENVLGMSITNFREGAWYWVQTVYSALIMITVVIRLMISARRAIGEYRRQLVTLLVGAVIPFLVWVIYLANVLPVNLDLNPFAFSLSTLIFGIAISQYRMLDIVPVAHQAVFSSLPEAVIVLDKNNQMADMNPFAEILFGKRSGEVYEPPSTQGYSPWQELIEKAQALQSGSGELALKINGENQLFELDVSTLRDEQSQITGKVLVLRDITQRMQAQHSLQEANDRLKALGHVDKELMRRLRVNYVADIALDAAMRISGADAALINLIDAGGPRIIQTLGRYPSSAVGKAISEDRGITRRVMRTQKAEMVLDVTQDPDYVQVIPDMQAQISIPLEASSQVIGVLTIETAKSERFTPDIFETLNLLATRVAAAMDNAKMYEERERLVDELQTFAHTVAHDLKNPLSNIKGYGMMMRDMNDRLNDTQRSDYLSRIINNADKATEIINALLMLAGAHSTNNVETAPLDMQAIVESATSRLAPQFSDYQAELVTQDNWPEITGYRPWVEQVWVNYMTNALKYGGSPPRVELGCDAPNGGHTRFWVRDNGEGLTDEQQATLFRSFTRLHEAYDKEGHGLGLSIVQRIVERLGGTVGVESKLGEGSRFWFTLPNE